MLVRAAVLVVALVTGVSPPAAPVPDAAPEDASLVRITGRTVAYRAAGEFSVGNQPADGPLATVAAPRAFSIMRRQVTRGDYEQCVTAGACRKLSQAGDAALPAIGVNWHDATAYAAWRTTVTGQYWRLPDDIEWAVAAGSRYRDDALNVAPAADGGGDPAQRWLADYDQARDRPALDATLRPGGGFGRNENGLDDLAGNVWEWTNTCFTRHRADAETGKTSTIENCGVRVAEGVHRAYMQTFFRDPKGGACSVGLPPIHLGFRLVRDDRPAPKTVPSPSAAVLLLGPSS